MILVLAACQPSPQPTASTTTARAKIAAEAPERTAAFDPERETPK